MRSKQALHERKDKGDHPPAFRKHTERIRDLSKRGWRLLPGNPTFTLISRRAEEGVALLPFPKKQMVSTCLELPKAPGDSVIMDMSEHVHVPLGNDEKSHFLSQMNFSFCNSRTCSGCPIVLRQNTGHVLFRGEAALLFTNNGSKTKQLEESRKKWYKWTYL